MSEALETVCALLKSGNAVELNASGYSMYPSLRPGDRVLIKALSDKKPPLPGTVVVFESDGDQPVMHRLLDVKGNIMITRGDSMPENDQPVEVRQLIGEAVSFKRNGIESRIKCFSPGKLRYLWNNLRLNLGMRIARR